MAADAASRDACSPGSSPDDEGDESWISLSEPDIDADDMAAVLTVMRSSRLALGPVATAFESAFAGYVGREHGVSMASGTAALMNCLRAMDIGSGDEVIASPYAWHQIAHAIVLVGATPVFADMDYWSGTLSVSKVAEKITSKTKAILAGNTNGHPAPWDGMRELARTHGIRLIEDSTEAIGSLYKGRAVGNFGDCAIFDFSQPSALACGEGAMILTDDAALASELRYLRQRSGADRVSVSIGSRVPLQAAMSELHASLGLAQLARIDGILARRKQVESCYLRHMQAFEGIKPPYRAPEVDEIHWFVYLVHLGTRFTRSARNQMIDDLATEKIEALPYCNPLHQQFFYARFGYVRGDFFVTEKISDRGLVLPFHGRLSDDEVMFIVSTAKDTSINVGAGAAIY